MLKQSSKQQGCKSGELEEREINRTKEQQIKKCYLVGGFNPSEKY